MRAFLLSSSIVALLGSTAFFQVQTTKAPIEAGMGCVDVTRKLDSQVKNGQMIVSQCCGGLKLLADVKEETVNKKKVKHILKWHVVNANAKELEADLGTAIRERVKAGNETIRFEETIIVVKEPKVCFIVGRKNR
ncbi:MAG: hypothetical protein ACR2LM_19760 [Pyrinomonadaceae bacterium]